MSDFLSNLVTRSLGTSPVVQPRLPSLFEPSRPYAGSLAEPPPARGGGRQEASPEDAFEDGEAPPVQAADHSQVTAARRSPAATRGPARKKPASANQDGMSPALESPSREASAGPDLPPAVAHSFLTHKPDDEPAKPMPDAVPATPFGKIPRASAPVARPAIADISSAEEKPAGPSVRRAESAPYERPARLTAQTAALPSESEPREDSPRNPLAKSVPLEPARAAIAAPASRPAAAFEPPETSRFEFARHIPQALIAGQPEPAVQVTIGRIEVRVVSSPSSTTKERGASPVLSLNDYLRRRSEQAHA